MTVDPAGSRVGRRAEQRARRRKQRRRLAAVGVALGVAVLLLVVVVLVRGGGDTPRKVAVQKRTQHTLLMQVKVAGNLAVASALLAHDGPSATGSVVLIPPQVFVTVPGSGSTIFGKALQVGSVDGARAAIEDLMGVTIDGSWVLDSPSFQRLIDVEGGVTVTVDVPVLAGRAVLIQPGSARLDGAHALQFATYLAPGEPEQSRLARLQAVIDAVVTALPADPRALVTSLGAGAVSTGGPDLLPDLLSGLKKDNSTSDLQYRSLPVIKVDPGNDDIRFRIDAPATQSMVDELLAQSVPPGARTEGNRVLVLNGVGTPGLGEKVRAKLVPAGFVFVGSRNAPSFGQCCTQVLVKDATLEGTALGNRVAKALGVPSTSVMTSDQLGTIADVIVIVGKDFVAK